MIMRLRGGGEYSIDSLPDEDCMALVEEFKFGAERVLTLNMDNGSALVYVPRKRIAAIEFELD